MLALSKAVKHRNKFQNPVPTEMGGLSLLLKVLPLYLTNKAESEPKEALGPFPTDPAKFALPHAGLRVTWFGHSASLLEMDGARILIDPVWERASPVSFAGPKRFFPPTIALADLPPLDVILISHDHYDHLGAETIRTLATLPSTAIARYVTSLGVAARLVKLGVPPARITELDWTESTTILTPHSEIKIDAWPARHFSGRGLFDRFKTLWSSFVIGSPRHRIFYGADSGAWDGFASIAAQYDHFDLTMLEVGASHPLWENIHLGPRHAIAAFQSMGGAAKAGLFMPIHWGLFNLALHAWRDPIQQVGALATAAQIPLFAPTPGQPTAVTGPLRSTWWHPA